MLKAEYAKYKNGEISLNEYMEYKKDNSGSVLSESDQSNFRTETNDDTRDSDGTGTGSTMYLAVEGMEDSGSWDDYSDPHNGLTTQVHERVHQYNADRGKIDNKEARNGNPREENNAARVAHRIIRQINRATGTNTQSSKKYSQ